MKLWQKGAYLVNHKVCLDERYGDTFATLKILFTPSFSSLTIPNSTNALAICGFLEYLLTFIVSKVTKPPSFPGEDISILLL